MVSKYLYTLDIQALPSSEEHLQVYPRAYHYYLDNVLTPPYTVLIL
jgi:hypothetical protein